MTVERRPEERALDRMILELREAPAPKLDWERMEARLLSQPLPRTESKSPSFWSRLRLPAAGLVAVAAIASVIVARKPLPEPAKQTAHLSDAPLNGDTLALGTRITAGNQPLVVEHQGRARWTLEPHATAFVSDAGEFLTVKLSSGALSAAVVPNPKPETFAVEVEGTRVAVHGTAFRVERVADRVQVDVSEGTVAVEPSGTHSTPAFLLRRNSRGNFALDGRTGTVEGNASAVVADGDGRQSHRTLAKVTPAARAPQSAPAAQPAKPTATEPSAQAQSLPAQPSISDIEKGVSSALELMNRCFHDQTRTTGNRVSANTALTLTVAGDGTIQSVTFAPPLAPGVEECAVGGLRSVTFARSVEGVTFTRLLELSR
ncbi:MAG TPA: FecR domain-containing protein [Polyangiaceae bacterium]|nr:FecR domain-containing protein [Polyangiaceae bacterium]